MKPDYRNTLLLPFERGLLAPPSGSERWLVLNARPLPADAHLLKPNLVCEQGFRPEFLALESAGYDCQPAVVPGNNYAGAMVLAGRVRQVNEANIARAWNSVRQGGPVLVAGNKTSGIQSLRKWAGKSSQVQDSLSKHHAVVFWLKRDGADLTVPDLVKNIDGFHVAAGMFSADGADPASSLLVEQFGPHIRGCVADFGAGWGYLSAELIRRSDAVTSLALYEADHASLEAAKFNLSAQDTCPPASFYWSDIASEFGHAEFNWVIMNPPFHTGRAADPDLGRKFIDKAANALMPGGHLLMVANRQLPYEETLKRRFRRVELKVEQSGFKIIEAVMAG